MECNENEKKKDQEFMEKLNYADKNIIQEVKFKSEDLVKYEQKIKAIENEIVQMMNETNEKQERLPKLTEVTK